MQPPKASNWLYSRYLYQSSPLRRLLPRELNLSSESRRRAPNLSSEPRLRDPNRSSGSRVRDPSLSSESRLRVPNLSSESRPREANLSSESRLRAPSLSSDSERKLELLPRAPRPRTTRGAGAAAGTALPLSSRSGREAAAPVASRPLPSFGNRVPSARPINRRATAVVRFGFTGAGSSRIAAMTPNDMGRSLMTGCFTIVIARCAADAPEKLTSIVLRSTGLRGPPRI